MDAYTQLEAVFAKVHRFKHFTLLGDWDASVMMPPKGNKARGEAMAELQNHIHGLIANAHVKELLAQATAVKDSMSAVDQANLREMQRVYDQEAVLPEDFVERKAKLVTEAKQVWAQARANNDFAMYLPYFKRLIASVREEAKYRAGDSGVTPFGAILDVREPGVTVPQLDALFDDVKSWLPQLLKDVLEAQKSRNASIVPLQTPIPWEKQEPLNRFFAKQFGYDFEAGRLDISAHPFTVLSKEDARITTHFSPDNYQKSIFATIHETGHSTYETNCGPREKLGQPVCMARGGGLHESQSRFAEVVIGRSGAFAEYMTPYLKEYLGDQPAFTVENVRKLNHVVQPGFIRVAADEVCYPLHVILRYEIERDLIDGKMEPEDVPRVWNAKMKEYLGLDTEGRDDIGCLQDVHWSMSYFCGFPQYAIGSIFAAQLMATIKKELGADTVDKAIRSGQLEPIFVKQREKIWSQGCMHSMDDLMTKATGEKLNAKHFREYLERRYLHEED